MKYAILKDEKLDESVCTITLSKREVCVIKSCLGNTSLRDKNAFLKNNGYAFECDETIYSEFAQLANKL